jgi:hypothetical protein
VDNLKIGGSYNLTQIVNFPMWVIQQGAGRCEIRIETTIPSAADLKSGYEAIPDKSWVSYSKNDFILLSGETGNVDVTINVPDNRKYMGKKYMAHVFITANPPKGQEGGVAVALGIKGKVYISVAGDPLTENERLEMKKKRALPSQGIIIVPEKLYHESEQTSGELNVTEAEPLKLINPSKENIELRLEPADPVKTGIQAPTDYVNGRLTELRVSKEKLTLKPDGIENISVFVKLKKEEKQSKRFYVIKITVKSKTIEISKFIPIYIN